MSQQPENDAPTATIAPLIVVHGGAGDIPDARDHGKLAGCRLAARLGYAQLLLSNGSAVDAVEAAVRSMELDEYFNAGYGAVLDLAGNAVLEASIQDGRTLAAGAATLFGDILQPITLARRIMERSRHSFLGGAGAVEFASQHGIEIMRPAGQLVTQYARDALDEFRASGQDGMVEIGHRRRGAEERVFGEVGTVGAVAIDRFGNVASATSTGGMTGKAVGRIGDTPLLGAGTYADNAAGAVSATGHGEAIMRYALAARIAGRMEWLEEGAQQATQTVLEAMHQRLALGAGAITVDRRGGVGVWWTSQKMAWAWQRDEELVHFGIRKGEEFVEKV